MVAHFELLVTFLLLGACGANPVCPFARDSAVRKGTITHFPECARACPGMCGYVDSALLLRVGGRSPSPQQLDELPKRRCVLVCLEGQRMLGFAGGHGLLPSAPSTSKQDAVRQEVQEAATDSGSAEASDDKHSGSSHHEAFHYDECLQANNRDDHGGSARNRAFHHEDSVRTTYDHRGFEHHSASDNDSSA